MKLVPSMGALKGYDSGKFGIYHGNCLDECEEIDHNVNNNVNVEDANETIIAAVKVLLQGLGEDVNREGLKKTPIRVAKAFQEGTRGYHQTAKDVIGGALFPEAGIESGAGCGGGSGGLVMVRNIDLFSYCEACLLPFKVRCHIAYISSGQQVVGLSKLSRVAEVFCKRLQSPQRLANEISEALTDNIKPLGVALILECWHIQFPGVEGNAPESEFIIDKMQGWIHLSVFAASGLFENENSDVWNEFIDLLHLGGVNIERPNSTASHVERGIWCPFPAVDDVVSLVLSGRTSDQSKLNCHSHTLESLCSKNSHANSKLQTELGASYSVMLAAVESILSVIGEDPWREELHWTPIRFVRWLSNFHRLKPAMQSTSFHLYSVDPERHGSSERLNGTLDMTEVIGSEILLEFDVPFCSQCEHHLLPFSGVAHIGYFSLKKREQHHKSKINDIVQFLSHRLQVQERLTKQIAETIATSCNAVSIMVVVEANHICMLSRGIEKIGSSTATVAVLGRFSTDSATRAALLKKVSSRFQEQYTTRSK